MNGMPPYGKRPKRRALLSASCGIFVATVSAGCSLLGKPVIVTAEQLCKDWGHMTVSKHDKLTQETAEQIEANNLSRPAWGCKLGENRAG